MPGKRDKEMVLSRRMAAAQFPSREEAEKSIKLRKLTKVVADGGAWRWYLKPEMGAYNTSAVGTGEMIGDESKGYWHWNTAAELGIDNNAADLIRMGVYVPILLP